MNIILCYNDSPRYFTVGSYIKKVLVQQNEINILSHCRIPEDTGVCRESSNPDTNLILIIDCGTHFKLHHEKGFLPKNVKTAFWISDLHRTDWAKHRLQMIKEWHYDHVFYAQKNFKEMIIECGYSESQCSWLPHAADPDIFKPMENITKRYDIGYVGYKNSKREKAEEILKEYMRFKHFSSVWAWTAARCMNELKIGFNISVENDVCNMRTFETLSCGLPLLINKVEGNGMEDLFPPDMYLAFSSEQELKEYAIRLLASKDLRNQMGKIGREHLLKYHTYRNRINTILGTMGFELLK